MKKAFYLLFLLLPFWVIAQDYSSTWEEHFSFFRIKDIAAGNNKIFTASENALFITPLGALDDQEKITSINGLSGEEISVITYAPQDNLVVIGYENGLIQIYNVTTHKVRTFIDIIQKPTITPEERRINGFDIYGNKLYIATNYGISAFDLSRLEFGDTYYIGNGGDKLAVTGVAIHSNRVYAATQGGGLRYTALDNPNMVNYEQWHQIDQGNLEKLVVFQSNLYVSTENNTLKRLEGNSLIQAKQFSKPIRALRASEDNLSVTLNNEVQLFTPQLNLLRSYTAPDFNGDFSSAIVYGGNLYVGDQYYGLLRTGTQNNSGTEYISPNGPLRNDIFNIDIQQQELWAVYGEFNFYYNPYPLTKRGVSHLTEDQWLNIPYENLPEMRSMSNIKINPNNPEQVFVTSFRDGLMELQNHEVTHYFNTNNSNLEPTENPAEQTDAIRLNPIAFDQQGNIWLGSGMNTNGLIRYPIGGGANSFNKLDMSSVLPNPSTNAGIGGIAIDNSNNVYMGTYNEGLVGYNPTTNKFAKIKGDKNQGNLPTNYVRTIALDHNNQLWIGTSRGLRVLYGPSQMFDNPNTKVSNIVFLDDNDVAQELLSGLAIIDIAVDGNNNKWIGSTAGVYQISSDGQRTLNRFTIDNSPLPSNNINSIKIDDTNGKVYIATQKGMVVFRGSATKAQDNLDHVRAYPNPVRPRYEGMVTIDGLMRNANVKITDIEGNLVYEEFSKGGSIQWDTRAFGKHKVASGVYLVLITSDDQAETKVAKIMIIR